MNRKVIVVLGSTATGKSDLSVRLAKKFKGEVISADSRQVYRGLDLGTGKITEKEMAGIPHHLLDVADPKKPFSADKFKRLGRKEIAAIYSRGKVPIICGGTGFYISALLGEVKLANAPINKTLRKKLTNLSPAKLLSMLQKLDPNRAQNLNESDRANPVRLIRAIEVAEFSKSKTRKAATQSQADNFETPEVLKIGLTLPSAELKEKIMKRLLVRLDSGMLAEAKRLHGAGLSWKRMIELGLEYRFMALHLQNEISKEEMIGKLYTAIWHYARRQMTWFKRDKSIQWFTPSQISKLEQVASQFLKQKSA